MYSKKFTFDQLVDFYYSRLLIKNYNFFGLDTAIITDYGKRTFLKVRFEAWKKLNSYQQLKLNPNTLKITLDRNP